jgi:5-methylcytosine-specific restriction endonuclease McrA
MKFKVMERDSFRCIYCGKSSIEDKVILHIDHIIPESRGGKFIFDNLVTSCDECNQSKGATILSNETIDRLKNRL